MIACRPFVSTTRVLKAENKIKASHVINQRTSSSVLISNLVSNRLLSSIDNNFRRSSSLRLLLLLLLSRGHLSGTAHARNRGEIAAGRVALDEDADILWRTGDVLRVKTGDVDALGLVLVGGRNDLDYVIPRELKLRDVHGRAVHQVGVEDAEDRLMGDDEEVVLLALELEDDWLQADG